MITNPKKCKRGLSLLFAASLLLAACGDDTSVNNSTTTPTAEDSTGTELAQDDTTTTSSEAAFTTDADAGAGETSTFQIDVWADNWSAVYVNGTLIGEDSVSITTERSFNAETFTFEATYPFTVAIEAKDFKETDSGIEYIGEGNQQMGDGGIIAQITDTATGEIVSSTSSSWNALVIHRAPLNTECERDADPDATCQFEASDAPDGWTNSDFDDSGWSSATEWSEADVSPKDGYDEISWTNDAELIWGTDLEVDNTVLLRTTVSN